MTVTDEDTMELRDSIAAKEGFLLCPEGAATAVAYRQALQQGLISADDRAVLWNCATGLKYPMGPVNKSLDQTKPIDYSQF
jgi:threonine synthase